MLLAKIKSPPKHNHHSSLHYPVSLAKNKSPPKHNNHSSLHYDFPRRGGGSSRFAGSRNSDAAGGRSKCWLGRCCRLEAGSRTPCPQLCRLPVRPGDRSATQTESWLTDPGRELAPGPGRETPGSHPRPEAQPRSRAGSRAGSGSRPGMQHRFEGECWCAVVANRGSGEIGDPGLRQSASDFYLQHFRPCGALPKASSHIWPGAGNWLDMKPKLPKTSSDQSDWPVAQTGLRSV